MRAGIVVSAIGHIGAVLMTLLIWETRSNFTLHQSIIVPVEIVDIAPESNVRATAIEPTPEETTPPPAPQQQNEDVRPTPTPASVPAPHPRQRSAQEEQDAAMAAAQNLINHDRQQPQRRTGAQGQRNQAGAGLGTAERASLEDRTTTLIQRAMINCWRMPADLPDPQRLVVTLQFRLNRNGTLSGQPTVVSPQNYQFDPPMNQAVSTALRAVRSCDFSFLPSDPLVGPHYEIWQEDNYTFRVTDQ